jgi:predicted restriction endonuclease
MLGVSESWTVTASSRLTTGENLGGILTTVSQRRLILPAQERLWPSPENLQWHRANVYRTMTRGPRRRPDRA